MALMLRPIFELDLGEGFVPIGFPSILFYVSLVKLKEGC
jgi:hypothetical protein